MHRTVRSRLTSLELIDIDPTNLAAKQPLSSSPIFDMFDELESQERAERGRGDDRHVHVCHVPHARTLGACRTRGEPAPRGGTAGTVNNSVDGDFPSATLLTGAGRQ